MKYFVAETSANSKIIGSEYPQCIGIKSGYNLGSAVSVEKFAYAKGKRIDYIPDLDGFILDEKSKITDVISCGLGPGTDTVVSLRLHELLLRYKTNEVQYFDSVFYKKKIPYKYVWVHHVYKLEEKVDFKNSVLYHPDKKLKKEIEKIGDFKSFDNFYTNVDKYGLIKSKFLVIRGEWLDYFVIGRFNQNLYMCERLVEEIKFLRYTGLEFTIAEDIKFVR